MRRSATPQKPPVKTDPRMFYQVSGLMRLNSRLTDNILYALIIVFNLFFPADPKIFNHRLVSSVGRKPDQRAGALGFEPQTGSTLRVLKLLRRTCCLCIDICKWLDVLVCSDKDDKQ